MKYSVFDENGMFVSVFDFNESLDKYELPKNCIPGLWGSEHFAENGAVYEIPQRPSALHIFNYATKQWVLDVGAQVAFIFSNRASLLQASDWTQLPDVPLATKEAWATYRQALRDITSQPGYPLEVVWPVAP